MPLKTLPSSCPPAASVCAHWPPAAASSSPPDRPPPPAASAAALCAWAGLRGEETAALSSGAGCRFGWLKCSRQGNVPISKTTAAGRAFWPFWFGGYREEQNTLNPFLPFLLIWGADLKAFIAALDDEQALPSFFICHRLKERKKNTQIRWRSSPSSETESGREASVKSRSVKSALSF